MITGFKCYKYYMSLKLHFTKDKYNVFETRGHVKGSEQTFLARNDRFLFERIARKYESDREVIQFFVANFAYGNDAAVYDMEEAHNNYVQWQKSKQSMTKVFSDDLAKILLQCEKDKLNSQDVFEFVSGKFPLLLKMYIGKQISIQTMFILNKLDEYLKRWYNHSMLLWEDEARRIEKCDGFIKFDNEKVSSLFNNFRKELSELNHG